MGGMFGELKKLSTQITQPVSYPAKATAPPIKNLTESPPEAPVLPPDPATDQMTPTTTPLPGSAEQMNRDKRVSTHTVDLPANPQASKPVNLQTVMPANPQASKPASQQTSKTVNLQASKPTKKFTSYLTEESIRALKRMALDEDKKDYEVLQEAVDTFLLKKDSSSQ